MRWIVGISLRFRLMAVAAAAGMLALGIVQLRTMPVDILPEFSAPYVEVQTEALGLSAEEVEQLITVPLEQDLLNGVAWIDRLESQSMPGLSSIGMTFKDGTDLYRARQMVGERLTQAFALPHVSKPPTMMQPASSTSRVMIVGLSSKTVSAIDMSVLARWTVSPRLMGVSGVSNVAIWGQRDRQLQVLVDPAHLRDQRTTLLQVMETTGNAMWVSSLTWVEASTPGTGGFIETASQRLGIRHVFPIKSAQDLGQVPVEASLLRLHEVATVVENHQPLIGDAVGEGANLLLVVEKLPGANTLAVTQGIEKVLANMQPGMPGVEIDTSVYRPATYIEQSIGNLSWIILAAYVLAALALGLFLFEWRSALIGLVAIPLALMAGIVVLGLRGASLNSLVVAGLAVAVGVIVHDAILSVDAVARRLWEHRPEDVGRSKLAVVLEAAVESRTPVLYAALILLLAILPVFFVGGEPGAFYAPLALSYGLAVVTSMLVALTVTPAVCLLLLSKSEAPRSAPLHIRWIQRAYHAAQGASLRSPAPVFAVAGVLLVAGLVGLPFLKPSLVPTFKEQNLTVALEAVPGTSHPEMNRIAGRIADEIRSIPGVRNVGAHVGRAILSDKVMNVNTADLWVSIDPSAPYEATVAALQQVVDGYPGLSASVRGYVHDRTRSIAPLAENSLTVRVFGENAQQLRASAEDVRRSVSSVKGVSNAQIMWPTEEPTLDIQVDVAAAQRYGLKPGDVRRAAATLVSGMHVGSLFDEQKVFDVVVWGAPHVRGSLEAVQNLLIDTATIGQTVRLGDVAKLHVGPSPIVIRHDSARSYLDIRADVSGRSLDAVAADIGQRVQGVSFPIEYHAEVLGGYAERQAAQNRVLALAVAVLLGTYLLLQAATGSWRLAALALAALAASVSGGVAVAYAGGAVLSLGVLAGLLAVYGLAVRNTVVLFKRCQQLQHDERETFGAELVRRAAREHVVPVVATAVSTALFFVPFGVFGGRAGFEILQPMAFVVFGGLITSTFISLFAVPALCLRFGASLDPVMLFESKAAPAIAPELVAASSVTLPGTAPSATAAGAGAD
jgi:CzcA family heavy metal efflux pump